MSTEGQSAAPLLAPAAIPVSTAGILPTDAVAVVRQHLAPILGPWATSSRVRLTRLPEPGLRRPLVAQVDVQLTAGRRVRARVSAASMSEVVGLLATRIVEQLHLFPDALPGCLRPGVSTVPPPSPPELLPPDVRRVIRRKAGQPATMSVGEAIVVLEAMDYRFHLFREKYSRQESIVIHGSSGGYRILQARPNPIGLETTSPPIVLGCLRRSSLLPAKARLDLTGAAFDVFTDHRTGLPNALYARYDGHYGLLTSAAAVRSAHGTG